MPSLPDDFDDNVKRAIVYFWKTRESQARKQNERGTSDQGARSAVTGGAQMDSFVKLLSSIIKASGVSDTYIHYNSSLELPGYFRPTKKWDLLVVGPDDVLVVIEAKSQIGPSFGNNFNNRVEEATGSAIDFWTAYREGAFNTTFANSQPWLGYMFLLEDCLRSNSPVGVNEPYYPVFPEFRNASYTKRYELFCKKLLYERHYSSVAFLTSKAQDAETGNYLEPADELRLERFCRNLMGYLGAYVKT